MESHEVLKETIREVGVKQLASDMGLSSSLIYKWCESSEGDNAAGADNPLDRIVKLCATTDSKEPVAWLCEKMDGFLVKNVAADAEACEPVLNATKTILQKFSELLQAVTESVNHESRVDSTEAKRIRAEWEDLKRVGEQFTLACEQGMYRKKA